MKAIVRTFLVALGVGLALSLSAVGRGTHGSPKSASDESPIDPQQPTGRSALRQIVQNQCVLNWLQHHNPAPCERVELAEPTPSSQGYAVLADASGGAHYLLVPTQTMAGTDGGELLDPDMPNYFAEAWHARDLVTRFVGHPVQRTAVGLAVGIAQFRTQDQFHIHIACLRQEVVESLRAAAENVTEKWAPISVAGSTYQAQRVMGVGLDGSNPFELLAALSPDTRHHMGNYTLVVAGMQFKSGAGFVLLTGTGPSGEMLLDSTCAAAGAGG